MKTYKFRQNNSGGYFIENGKTGFKVILVIANDIESAYAIIEKNLNTNFCSCCGQRYYFEYAEYNDNEAKIEAKKLQNGYNSAAIITKNKIIVLR